MAHATATRPSQLRGHLGPHARSGILTGSKKRVHVLLTLSRNADLQAVIDAVKNLHCVVRGYLSKGRVLGVSATADMVEELARIDGVSSLESENSR